jgi:pimeloyl-ACP methyl ester carboxylesterase
MTQDRDMAGFHALGYDVVRPDWYGFGRSDGVFTPDTCFQTIVDSYRYFDEGGVVLDTRTRQEYYAKYEQIVLIGGSFGAWFAGRIGEYLPDIVQIGLFYPALVFADMGHL